MTKKQFCHLIKSIPPKKTFQAFSFGCRVNAAETNQLAQILVNHDFTPGHKNPQIILVNTCAVTKKGESESIRKVKSLASKYPQAHILITGCVVSPKLKNTKTIHIFKNITKQEILKNQNTYTPQIGDKYSSSHRCILKIQSGCNHFCSYCIVPFRRPRPWHLPIPTAVKIVNSAIKNGYKEIILTGTNLNLYTPGLSNLLQTLLTQTSIPLISFGSIPINCINPPFLKLLSTSDFRLSNFLHIPIQSGSDKILKLMRRPYTCQDIKKTFKKLKQIPHLSFGTDIIVGFPGETLKDFQQTYDFCQQIGFSKIHVFRYSPRPGTSAQKLFDQKPKIKNSEKIRRSQELRKLSNKLC